MKKNLLVARIIVMVIGIMLGVLLLVVGSILTPSTIEKIIDIGLIIYGVIIIIGNVPGLISGIADIRKTEGVFDLVTSVLGIGLGIAMIFYRGEILISLVAVYLIIFPIIRVLLSKNKGEQFKREILRILLGVVLWLFVPGLAGATAEIVHRLLVIAGWVVIALSALFGIIEIIRIAMAKSIVTRSEGQTIYVDPESAENEQN